MSFDTDPREEQDAEMYAAFAAKDKRIAELEAHILQKAQSDKLDRLCDVNPAIAAIRDAAQAGQEQVAAYAYEIIDRDESGGPGGTKLCYAAWIDRYQRATPEDIVRKLYAAPPAPVNVLATAQAAIEAAIECVPAGSWIRDEIRAILAAQSTDAGNVLKKIKPFCADCGKRNFEGAIHTCTPPIAEAARDEGASHVPVGYKSLYAAATCTYCGLSQNDVKRDDVAVDAAVRFAGMVLSAHRNDGYPGDIDGADLERMAMECGMTEKKTVMERCGETCSCAEFDAAFPTECLFECGKCGRWNTPQELSGEFVEFTGTTAHGKKKAVRMPVCNDCAKKDVP
jgi:hypothetical protein